MVKDNSFFIEDVSITGETRLHGPFNLGKAYGSKVEAEKINWGQIQRESKAKQNERQQALATELKAVDIKAGPTAALNFKVSKTGIYRVTYENLLAAGYNLAGVPMASMGLTSQGRAVPITVFGTTFGPGSYIEFLGEAPGYAVHGHQYLHFASQCRQPGPHSGQHQAADE